MPEPEVAAQEPPAASAPEATAPTDKATEEASANPETSSSAQPVNDPDVVITRTEFVEPGRPTALAKCSAKEELLQHRRANLDLTDYANLNIGEIVSGYVSQVHKSRDVEIGMVNVTPENFGLVLFIKMLPGNKTFPLLSSSTFCDPGLLPQVGKTFKEYYWTCVPSL